MSPVPWYLNSEKSGRLLHAYLILCIVLLGMYTEYSVFLIGLTVSEASKEMEERSQLHKVMV